MPVTAADIKMRYSTTAGTQGDTQAGTAAGSLGKYISTTEIATATAENLFDNASRQEAQDGDIEYRCCFIANKHATDSLFDAVIWIESQVPDGATIAIGVDPIGVVPIGDTDPQAAEIADEGSAPSGVTFSTPTSFEEALTLGTLGPDQCIAIWVRRTVPGGSAAKASDGATIKYRGFPTEG